MEIHIREYIPADQKQMLRMQVDLVDKMSQIDPHKRFRSREDLHAQRYFEALQKDLAENQGTMFVAENDGTLVGYISARIERSSEIDTETKYPAKQGYIEGLFVDEAHRGKGISSRLMEHAEKYFRKNGCDFSSVACVAVNEAARKFYAKQGYAEQYIDLLKKL